MPEDKSDFLLVGTIPLNGRKPVGLRVTKVVRGKDESLYTFLLPGTVPDPLKLSIHPTGEIQLKSKRAGLITRLDQEALFDGLASGELDVKIARFLAPKLDHEPGEGFVLSPDLVPTLRALPSEPLKDVEVPVDRLINGLTKVRIGDVSRLHEAIAILRKQNQLPPKATLQLVTESSDKPIVFLSLLERAIEGEPVPIPEGTPFPKTLQAFLDSLRVYGGIVFTMPDEGELRELAKTLGLGDLFDGLSRFAYALDDPDVEQRVRKTVKEIAVGFRGAADRVYQARPLRPLGKTDGKRFGSPPL